jgi:hypothetical protein
MAESYPKSLLSIPRLPVALLGPDEICDHVTKTLKKTNDNENETSRLRYLHFPMNHEFRRRKFPVHNYVEGYVPKGILKKNWVEKHQYTYPSIIIPVMEFDCDVNFQQWIAAEDAFCSDILRVRAVAESLRAKFVVLMIQKRIYSRTQESKEKAALLDEKILR